MERKNEGDFIARLKAGDAEAMAELSEIYSGKIYNVALGILKKEDDAQDVLQDTLLQVIQKVDTFRGESALSTWLYRIAVNFCYQKLRRKSSFEHISIADYMPSFDKDGNHLWPINNWASDTTAISAATNELRVVLKTFIEELPDKYRTVLILRDVEGLSNDEISIIVDLTVPCVKTRLHRARLCLRKRLSKFFWGKKESYGEELRNCSQLISS